MNYHFEGRSSGLATIGVAWQRRRDRQTWLLTIDVMTKHGIEGGGPLTAAFPQADAVMDDYGTLVCVTPWN